MIILLFQGVCTIINVEFENPTKIMRMKTINALKNGTKLTEHTLILKNSTSENELILN